MISFPQKPTCAAEGVNPVAALFEALAKVVTPDNVPE